MNDPGQPVPGPGPGTGPESLDAAAASAPPTAPVGASSTSSTLSTVPESRAAGEPVAGPEPVEGRSAAPGHTASAPPVVAALVADLFFSVPIADAIRAAGAQPLVVHTADELAAAIERWPALVLIDLNAMPNPATLGGSAERPSPGTQGRPVEQGRSAQSPGSARPAASWQTVIRRARLLPQTRAIPIVAFGSHLDHQALAAARAAGCDHAWARSRFVAELPALLQRTLHPPLPDVRGCDEPPPPGLLHGIDQFNAGEYWDCHETLETLWRAEPRPVRDLYQGVLQVGVAFHHLRQGNYAGAVKMLRRGLPRLRRLPATCQRVPVADLRQAAEEIHARLVDLGADRLAEFDLASLPVIELA